MEKRVEAKIKEREKAETAMRRLTTDGHNRPKCNSKNIKQVARRMKTK